MRPPISAIFCYESRPPNCFYDHELEETLCRSYTQKETPFATPLSFGTEHAIEAGNKSYNFALKKSDDGKSITLDAVLKDGDTSHTTTLRARQVKGNLYEITELTFDNKKEGLNHRQEIYSVLDHIGEEMLAKACNNQMPVPHQEKGKFGMLGRFWNRMCPDNPMYWPGC